MPTNAEQGPGWLRRFHPATPGATRLVCLPHAGGAASYYFPFSRSLAPRVEVLAVQYPGRQDRLDEPPLDRISRLVDGVEAALGAAPSATPLAFFGHSMGAVIAYETALRLQDRGFTLDHVFVSGRRAPSCYRTESVHQRDDEGIIEEIALLGGTNVAALRDPDLLAMAMPALRADYQAIETYRHVPGHRLRCPVTVLVGDADPRTTTEETKAWAGHVAGPLDVRVFPGDHFYLNQQAAAVTALVAERLAPA
ncbi:alpha/beta fold hydrolase [Micromonospora sp. WMMD882]|uniref:thioesterase II family protein n=1 Tax=Micromonospora sp. WMMD882 TaxID=3015151 RepID=UPI00248AFBAE|nr:alpha/beta fold hydrolase [Micromonospora sp. WMMD882]WBB81022.1 alpha/beta fold hydrolase [Micromonospora sp. WMMD882]